MSALSVDPRAAALISPWVARECNIVPTDVDSATLTVAAVERDPAVESLLFALTGLRIEVVTAAPEAIAQAHAAAYARPAPQQTRVHSPAGAGSRAPLGQLLRDRDVISLDDLEHALQLGDARDGRLGDVLLTEGYIDEVTLADALADQAGAHRTDIRALRPEPQARELVPDEVGRRHRIVPLLIQDHRLYVAADGPLSRDALRDLREHTALQIEVVIGTRSAVDELVVNAYAESSVKRATSDLLVGSPEESASDVLTSAQRFFLLFGAAALVVGAMKDIVSTLIFFNVVTTLFYLSFSIYKFKMMYDAVGHEFELPVSDDEVAALRDAELPVYSILVPLYHEAAVVSKLTRSIATLDYPRSKLDVKLIVEEDDLETRAAIAALDLPTHFKTIVVPDAAPKTKPKACNYALLHARGRYVVIYDAEDQPEPDQLKKVVVAFRKADANVACIQCKLNYFNRSQNLLTRWFTLEYSTWFDLFMPGLDAADSPIPLGGTSNHLDRERLEALGAWDPFNVTEDCDLGLRLHRAGYRTAIVDSTTYEEANSDLRNWVRQRSRWVKGYIQTWLVHMRHPLRLRRQLGTSAFLSFQLVVAGTFIGFLLNPLYWLLTTLWLLTHAGLIQRVFPGVVFYPAAFGLYIGNFVFMYVNVAGALRRRYFGLVKYALLSPLYWALMSIGAWKGALQLVRRPHFWEKTVHGLDAQ